MREALQTKILALETEIKRIQLSLDETDHAHFGDIMLKIKLAELFREYDQLTKSCSLFEINVDCQESVYRA